MLDNSVFKLYHLEHELYKRKCPLLPAIIRSIIRFFYYAVIPPDAEIGKNASFSYNGLGVVLNHAVKIGDNVSIGHHVTIGRRYGGYGNQVLGTEKDSIGVPVIGNNVAICAGARILGQVKIGDNAIIGANAVVLIDVPENSTAVGVPAKIILRKKNEKSLGN